MTPNLDTPHLHRRNDTQTSLSKLVSQAKARQLALAFLVAVVALQSTFLNIQSASGETPGPLAPEIKQVLEKHALDQLGGGTTIYNPTLPNPGYLNKAQEKLSETLKPFDDYIRFVEPSDADASSFQLHHQRLKSWTTIEKKDIRTLLSRLFHVAPGLIVKAASGDKINLCRTTEVEFSASYATTTHPIMVANTAAQCVNLTDCFFWSRSQYEELVHELVHAADFANQISFSNEWVSFAKPVISKIRLKANFLSLYEKSMLANALRKEGEWPSLYGCENFVEGFAEYTTCYLLNHDRTLDPRFESTFANRLLVPTDKDISFAQHFRAAEIHMQLQQYDKGTGEIRQCLAIDPENASAHNNLAICLSKQSRFADASEECSIVQKYCESRHSHARWTEGLLRSMASQDSLSQRRCQRINSGAE